VSRAPSNIDKWLSVGDNQSHRDLFVFLLFSSFFFTTTILSVTTADDNIVSFSISKRSDRLLELLDNLKEDLVHALPRLNFSSFSVEWELNGTAALPRRLCSVILYTWGSIETHDNPGDAAVWQSTPAHRSVHRDFLRPIVRICVNFRNSWV